MSEETKLTRHRAKQKQAGITRFSVQLDKEAVSLLRRLCDEHQKTQGEFLSLAIRAADSLLAGRLQLAKAAPQPSVRIIVRPEPQERLVALDSATGSTDTPSPAENAPTAPLHEPEQDIDVDARIRAAAFVVEP